MIKLLPKLLAFMLMMLVASQPGRQAAAQSEMDLQPGIVIALANLNEHLSDVEHLMEASGFGQMKGLVRMGSAEYIRGIDPEQPIGAMLFFEGTNPEPDVLGFVPVTDIEDVLDTLAPFVEINEDGDDITLTAGGDEVWTVRVRDGYAFVTNDPEKLDIAPSNPAAFLEELPNEYNVAGRIFGQRIPAELRQQGIDLIRQGAEESMQNLGDGPEAELQRANFEYSMKSVESLVNETDELLLGFNIDEEGGRILFDMKVIGTPESRLARQSAAAADAPATRFGGFLLDSATFNFQLTSRVSEEDVAEVNLMLDNLRSVANQEMEKGEAEGTMTAEEAEAARKILGDVMDIAKSTLENGVIDMGGAVVMDGESLAMAMAASVGSTEKLESSLRELAELAEAEDAPVEFRFDAGTENGIRFHEIDLLVPEHEEEAREVLGERLTLRVGLGDDVVFISGGEGGNDLLEQCRNGSAAGDLPSGQANFHLLPFLRFVSRFQDAQELGIVIDSLPESADDQIRMTMNMVENGQTVRLEMQDGVLEIFGKIGQAMGGGMGIPAEDF